jgi:uncharacterized protein YbaR (Trm112 family)
MTLRIDENAALVRREDGELVLKLDGKCYARRDTIPIMIPEATAKSHLLSAAAFIAARMGMNHSNHHTWPAEAIEFIFVSANHSVDAAEERRIGTPLVP